MSLNSLECVVSVDYLIDCVDHIAMIVCCVVHVNVFLHFILLRSLAVTPQVSKHINVMMLH